MERGWDSVLLHCRFHAGGPGSAVEVAYAIDRTEYMLTEQVRCCLNVFRCVLPPLCARPYPSRLPQYFVFPERYLDQLYLSGS